MSFEKHIWSAWAALTVNVTLGVGVSAAPPEGRSDASVPQELFSDIEGLLVTLGTYWQRAWRTSSRAARKEAAEV